MDSLTRIRSTLWERGRGVGSRLDWHISRPSCSNCCAHFADNSSWICDHLCEPAQHWTNSGIGLRSRHPTSDWQSSKNRINRRSWLGSYPIIFDFLVVTPSGNAKESLLREEIVTEIPPRSSFLKPNGILLTVLLSVLWLRILWILHSCGLIGIAGFSQKTRGSEVSGS
jgi:hypothetical protein